MRSITTADELTPLQRLDLRETLQDLWRDQVRRITLLSLAMYDDYDAAEPLPLPIADTSPEGVERSLTAARESLRQLEAALRRLDDGTYGRCSRCGTPIIYAQLVARPLEIRCWDCRTSTGVNELSRASAST